MILPIVRRAVLQAWHAGSQAGHGLADVLFGDYNPGKLPMSFPHNVGQLPLYYNQNTGRPGPGGNVFWSRYADAPNEALIRLVTAWSYTSFEYSDLELAQSTLPLGEPVAVTVQLTNSGAHAGSEVVQLYIRDRVASSIRPLKELKGFQKSAWLLANLSSYVLFWVLINWVFMAAMVFSRSSRVNSMYLLVVALSIRFRLALNGLKLSK